MVLTSTDVPRIPSVTMRAMRRVITKRLKVLAGGGDLVGDYLLAGHDTYRRDLAIDGVRAIEGAGQDPALWEVLQPSP